MKRLLASVLATCLALGAVMLLPAPALAEQWDVHRIEHEGGSVSSSDGRIVYHGWEFRMFDDDEFIGAMLTYPVTRTWAPGDAAPTKVLDGQYRSLSGQRLVWGDSPAQTALLPGLTNQTTLPGGSVNVSGDRVAGVRDVPGSTEVFTGRIGDAAMTVLGSAGGYIPNPSGSLSYVPRIDGERVAWMGHIGAASAVDILTWKFGDAIPTALTNDPADQYLLGLSQDRLVWSESADTAGAIYTRKVGEGAPTKLADDVLPNFVGVSGDRVAWVAQPSASVWSVVTWKSGDAARTEIATYAAPVKTIEISGDRIAWCAKEGSAEQVFVWSAGESAAVRLTSDASGKFGPRLSGELVAWSSDWPQEGVYVAVTGETARKMSGATRLAGADRYYTALEISRSTFATGSAPIVVLATGKSFPDALSASGLAGVHGCPLLLTPDTLRGSLLAELKRLHAGKVIIVGGHAAVPAAIGQGLIDAGYRIERIGGADRYATAALVANAVKAWKSSSFASTAFVVRGDDFADALSVSPLAYSQGIPVLLTPPTSLAGSTRDALKSLGIKSAYIAGGAPAVSDGVKSAVDGVLASNGGGASTRWSGPNRYATGVAVANGGLAKGWATPNDIGLATGLNFPDALGGGAVCGLRGGVLLLTPPSALPAEARSFIQTKHAPSTGVRVFGGPSVVSDAVLAEAQGAL